MNGLLSSEQSLGQVLIYQQRLTEFSQKIREASRLATNLANEVEQSRRRDEMQFHMYLVRRAEEIDKPQALVAWYDNGNNTDARSDEVHGYPSGSLGSCDRGGHAMEVGETVVVVRPTELESARGRARPRRRGTSVVVQAIDGERLDRRGGPDGPDWRS